MLLKQHTVPLIICINIKIQKTIILNIHSYLNNKKINPMLLKQHTVPSPISLIIKNIKNKYTQYSKLL